MTFWHKVLVVLVVDAVCLSLSRQHVLWHCCHQGVCPVLKSCVGNFWFDSDNACGWLLAKVGGACAVLVLSVACLHHTEGLCVRLLIARNAAETR